MYSLKLLIDIDVTDKKTTTSDKESGGGVLISVKKDFRSELIISGENDECEQL